MIGTRFFLLTRYSAGATTIVLLYLVATDYPLPSPLFIPYLGILVGTSEFLASLGRKLLPGGIESGLGYLAVGCLVYATSVGKYWAVFFMVGSLVLQVMSLRSLKTNVANS